MNILCTICARGGSRGVKDKNIKPLMGKPLIAYTIEQALGWGRARRVVVSTDSSRIAETARRHGASVPFMRPKKLAGDRTAKQPVIRHAMLKSEEVFKERYDVVVDLDVTSPLRRTVDLDACLRLFVKKRPKTLFSAVRARRNPYFNMVENGKNGFATLCKRPRAKTVRRQDAPDVYDMNASIYFYSRNFLLDKKNTTPLSDRSAVYVMDEMSQYDIDSELDFRFVEFLMKKGIWRK